MHVLLVATILRPQRSINVKLLCTSFLLLATLCSRSAVLDPPSLRCASVDAAGNVDLTWLPPPDPNVDFQQYIVYSSVAFLGPYAPVGNSFVYAPGSFTNVGAGADAGARFYYVTTLSVDPPPNESVTSDTLSTLFLTVGQSTPLGRAVLDWTLQHAPPIPTAGNQQWVELEYPIGTWTQIGQVDSVRTHFEQVISICEDSLTYRIVLQNQAGCTSYSNLTGDVFADVTAPTTPFLVTLTVDTATNQTTVDWDPSPEADLDGYIIIVTSGGNVDLDTLYGTAVTTYSWPGSDAASDIECYTVAAFDTCYSGTPPAPNTSAADPPHCTMLLSANYDRCASSMQLSWTPYVGWNVVLYELYTQENNGPYALLGSFPSSTLSFQQEDLIPFSSYCYVVKAIGASLAQISLSNQNCSVTDYPSVPQWNYLRTATVVANDHIVVIDSVDASASVRQYRLERTFNGEPWEEIATAPPTTGTTVVFNDTDVDTDLRSYTYRVIVEDSCGAEAVTSNAGTSLLLVAEAGADGVDHLRWNGYGQWAGSVSGYTVYRSIGDLPFVPIAFNAPNVWELDDDVSALWPSNGRFCYYVEALEAGNASGINAISTSNEACAIQQEALWIPNAFIAGSAISSNSSFRPVPAFIDVIGFELIIFNRWGQSIWSTSDRDIGWDGKVDDSYVPQGVYAFYCAFLNGAGKKFEERGTVTFLCCP